MNKNNRLLIFLLCFLAVQQTMGQSIDAIKQQCENIEPLNKANIAVYTFEVSAPAVSNGAGAELRDKLAAILSDIHCFTTQREVSIFIADHAQAIIVGTITDYYPSENAIGKSRIAFDLEIRSASTQAIIAQQSFKVQGKLFMGVGNNKPFADAYNKILQEAAVFIYTQKEAIKVLAPVVAAQPGIPNDLVKRKSVYDQMVDHGNKRRQEGLNLSLGRADYFNDTTQHNYKYKDPKKGSWYVEYKINGKPFSMYRTGQPGAYFTAITSKILNRLECDYRDSFGNKYFYLSITDPLKYPSLRRFEFGKNATKQVLVDGEMKDIYFTFSLKLMGPSPGIRYPIYAYIGPMQDDKVNVESGYIEVLYYEPGKGGPIELRFELVVQSGTTKDGKPIPSLHITEGRFRAIM
jgi:hypothetical protein